MDWNQCYSVFWDIWLHVPVWDLICFPITPVSFQNDTSRVIPDWYGYVWGQELGLLILEGHLQSRSIMVHATISIGVWKVQSCIARQGARDRGPCLRGFGTFTGAETPWEEGRGWAWAVPTPRPISFLQRNALPQSGEAGTPRGGSMFYRGFGVKPRFILQRRNIASRSPCFWYHMDFHRPFIKPSWICADGRK